MADQTAKDLGSGGASGLGFLPDGAEADDDAEFEGGDVAALGLGVFEGDALVLGEAGDGEGAEAEAADLHHTFVSRLERGDRAPSLETVLRFARPWGRVRRRGWTRSMQDGNASPKMREGVPYEG